MLLSFVWLVVGGWCRCHQSSGYFLPVSLQVLQVSSSLTRCLVSSYSTTSTTPLQDPRTHNSSHKMTDVSDSTVSANLRADFDYTTPVNYGKLAERKRGRDDVSGSEGKRVKVESDEPTVLKMLFPHELAGRVIGKGGSVLKQIMEDSRAKVRLSETDELIPETGERIVMAMGTPEAVALVADFILAILNEPMPGEVVDPSRAKPLKILVPEATTGSVIGKSGAVIKELMEVSGANIRVSSSPLPLHQTSNWSPFSNLPRLHCIVHYTAARFL